MHVAVIGWGNIAQALARELAKDPDLAFTELTALVRPEREAPVRTVHDTETLLAADLPDLVIECASHAAVAAHVPQCLRNGIDTVVASVGALSDAGLAETLRDNAEAGGARLILPAGALGGIDLLAALRAGGIEAVPYEGRKPPAAWKGSPAEEDLDLDALSEAKVIFDGPAREAAWRFPRNANVAATLALAGLGWDATQVRLIADPEAAGNRHRYYVTAAAGDFTMEVTGKPLPDNPRTSAATVLSLLREIRNRAGPVAI